MIDYHHIYTNQAVLYDRLVAREDYQGNIGVALANVRTLAGLDIVELGAGTGRLTRLLAPLARRVLAMDISGPMLGIAQVHLKVSGWRNCFLALADNAWLPLTNGSADMVLAGWSLGHQVGWHPDTWPSRIDRVISEMKRIVRPGGVIVILETMGTGRETPQPPAQGLAAYYNRLEQHFGFSSTWFRTDYAFESTEEGVALTRFFFGDGLARQLEEEGTTILAECTGLWWLYW